MPRLVLRFLGPPEIVADGSRVTTDRRKAVAMLAYLAVRNERYTRETLAALFWPDYDQSRANAYLRRTLWELNQAVGPGWVDANRESVGLRAEDPPWVDAVRFDALLRGLSAGPSLDAAALEEAVALYRGDFLAGFSLRDSPGFDEWQTLETERLRRQYGQALAALVEESRRQGEHDVAIAYARRRLSLDPLDEAAQRQLIELYAGAGQRNRALRQYEDFAALLKQELNVAPEPQTVELYERIKTGALVPAEPVRSAPDRAAEPPSHEIVAPPCRAPEQPAAALLPAAQPVMGLPLIGREAELAQITDLLARPECRLLTLTGPGGIGKTRLAMEAIRGAASAFADGAFFVPLAGVETADLLVPAIGTALRLGFATELGTGRTALGVLDPKTQVIQYLREKRLILVLDNFEHLLAGADLVLEILDAAPGVKILLTSRERLNLLAESVLEVPGLPVPPQDGAAQPLEDYAAVQLFLIGARRARVGFVLEDSERPAVAQICRRVAGTPLGIELAATWVRQYSCAEIAQEIERSLDFLEAPLRDLPERHRSLRAVFDRSWDLLSEAERSVLSKLSVFRGGFTQAAAAQAAGASRATLAGLVDKSLVHRSSAGRYELHELVRGYAAEQLAHVPGALAEMQAAHSRYYLGLMRELAEWMTGAREEEALRQIDLDMDNVGAAWYLALETRDPAAIYGAVPALALFCDMRGRYQEGEELVAAGIRALRAWHQADPAALPVAEALVVLLAVGAQFDEVLQRHDLWKAQARESLALLRVLPMSAGKALALVILAFGVRWARPEESEAWYTQTVEYFRTTGDRWGLAIAYLVRARPWPEEAPETAHHRELRSASLELFQALGHHWGAGQCHFETAQSAFWRGEYDGAWRHATEALEQHHAMNDRWRMTYVGSFLGQISMARGAYPEAERYYRDALDFAMDRGDQRMTVAMLDCLGHTRYLQRDFAGAEDYARRSLEINQQYGYALGAAMALCNLADALAAQGAWDDAQRRYQESLAIVAPRNDLWAMTKCLRGLGESSLAQGDLPAAREYLGRALQAARDSGRPPEVLHTLAVTAEVWRRESQPSRAAELLSLVRAHRATPRPVSARCDEVLAALARELPAEDFAAALRRGESADLDAYVSRVLG